MSHHDDNLYTILGKLAALQPKPEIKTSKEAAKKIYESVEARGSILSGVDAVQAKLAKQFAMERDESKLKKGHCSDCDCSPCRCEKCNECGMLESKCQCKQDMTEGAMSEIHMELSQVAQDEDYDRLSELMSDSGLVGQYLQHQVEEITSKNGLHPDDDFEEIENRLMDRIQRDFGDDDDMAEGSSGKNQLKQKIKELEKLARHYSFEPAQTDPETGHGYRPKYIETVEKIKKLQAQLKSLKGVAEASYINGKEEDPKSLRWKQTSMTQQQAITKYGKENVRVTRGGLRNGDDMVEVKVPLGEQGVAEGLGTSQDRLLARTGMNNAHKFPRDGQTNLGNIPGMNTPDASPETKAYADQQRAKRPGDLKAAIRGQLGKHHKPNLPEQDVEEGETVVKGNVSTHKGTYGNEYQGDPDDDDGKPAPKAPKVSNSKTGKKGRPTGTGKNQQTTGRKYDHSALSSILGGSAPKNKVKGTVHKMDESMDQVARRLTEGVNLLELLKEKHQTVDEMLAELSTDIANFKESGHCSELLKDCMDIKGAHKKAEPFTALDIAPAHAITPDATRLPHEFNSRPMEMDRELNELARLAGLSEDCGDMPPIGIAMQDMQSEQDNLSISTTYNSRDGKKTISVNADGKQAEDLLQMLRIAGLGGGEKAQELQARPGIEFDNIDGEASTVPQDDLEELPVDMQMHQDDAEMDEAEFDAPALEPVNGPKPEYKTMKQSTMGPGEGDAGEKAMHPDRPTSHNGDNALSTPATPPTRAQKTLIAVSTLESKLAAEYESIKKSK